MNKIPLDNQTFEHPWDEKLIENVGSVIVGGTPCTSIDKYWGNDIPWMSSGDIHLKCIEDVPGRISILGLNSSNATLVNPPSVAIGLAGQGKTRGTVALVLTTLCTNQSVALIKCEKNNLNIEYLFYNLESRYEELRSRSAGGGRAGLSKGILEKLTIPLPCIQEQDQIANVLSTIDLAITQTEAIIAKQQRIKTGLMQDLLTKGIDENGNIRSEATHKFKDSSIGRIPVEWKVESLNSKALVKGGKRLPLGHIYTEDDTGYRYLQTTDFINKKINYISLHCLLEKTFHFLERYEIKNSDIFISIAGINLGVSGVFKPDFNERTILTENAAKICLLGNDIPEYIAMQINGDTVQKQILEEKGIGAGVPKLALFRIQQFLIPFPSKQEQIKIHENICLFEETIEKYRENLRKLCSLKIGLMQDLLTGKVRVTPLLEQEPASR